LIFIATDAPFLSPGRRRRFADPPENARRVGQYVIGEPHGQSLFGPVGCDDMTLDFDERALHIVLPTTEWAISS